ncbi:ankyrin repeat domain-containing protein [Serratia nevei]|uniref:ankyrin repeat domain-containing protein n=1 Tax=Serratia nevei TaxID=2703794 RepID=UPI00254E49EA|nr:ankyrin repeat domain-containing protein [Serratia nevei]MDK5165557.1 ankyrin repeat domain-containing protein [Serratia nevei]
MDKEDVKEVMRLLLDEGVRSRERVLFTTSSEMLPIAKEFLSYDIDTRNGDGKTAFECALEMKEYSKAAWLLNEGCSIELCSETLNGEHSDNLICEAVREQYPNALRQIVASGVDINATDMYGQTELHRLCSEEVNPDGRLWCNQKDGGVSARMLIGVGADVNARDESDKTPLHHSIGSMASNVIDVLIKNGADPRIADKDGDTPVEYAQATGDRYLVDRLEAKIMELNLLDKHGVSKDAPRPARGREMTL